MAEHFTTNEVWQHGQNAYSGFTCNYCRCTKKGGGVTWFKQHLVTLGSNVEHCGSIPSDMWDYFRRELHRSIENKRARQWQSLLREEVAAQENVVHDIDSENEENVVHDIDSKNDEELQRAMHVSREEAQFVWRV
jgi:hypothetical protein